jgi:predicted O-methyltransferase YrrM
MATRIQRWQVLNTLIKVHGWAKGAELGVLDGDTLAPLLANNSSLHMIGVDLWGDSPTETERLARAHNSTKVRTAKYKDRVTLLKMSTTDGAATVEPESLDFIFIDATHSFEAVLEDLENWYDLVRSNGWILGHDWCSLWPDVQRAVEYFIKKNGIDANIILFDDAVWGFKKW